MVHDLIKFTVFMFLGLPSLSSSADPIALPLPNRFNLVANDVPREISSATQLRLSELFNLAKLGVRTDPQSLGFPVLFESIATEPSLGKAILVSSNIQVSAEFLNKLYLHPSGILVHKEIAKQKVALFFYGFKTSDVLQVITSFEKIYAARNAPPARSLASTDDTAAGFSEMKIPESRSSNFQGPLYGLGKSLESCYLEGVPSGVNNALITPFTMFWDGLKGLARSPKAWWNRSVQEWEGLKEFIKNFETHLSQNFKDFALKPEVEKSRIYCSFFSSAIAGGAGASALSKIVLMKLPSAAVGAASKVGALKKPPTNKPAAPAPLAVTIPPVSAAARARWEAVAATSPPKDVPYLVLGLTERLNGSTHIFANRFKHPAVDYSNWSSLNPTLGGDRVMELFSSGKALTTSEEVPHMIKNLVRASPNQKVLIFNTSGVNLKHFENFMKNPMTAQYTNAELKLILSDKNIFDHVRWWQGGPITGREMTFDEVHKMFYKFNPALFE